jgi:phosphate/sulfate permease
MSALQIASLFIAPVGAMIIGAIVYFYTDRPSQHRP